MQPDVVVIVAPDSRLAGGIGKVIDFLVVQAFVAQTAVEAFDQTVLLRFAGVDGVPLNAVVVGPFRFADRRFRIALLVNSVPLSLTMQVGFP